MIANDGRKLYWTVHGIWDGTVYAGGGVHAASISGGAVETLFAGEVPSKTADLQLDADYVYWLSETGVVRRVSKNGGSAVPVIGAGCMDIALDESWIYCSQDHAIVRARKDGAAQPEVLASGFATRTIQVAVDYSSIYFTVQGEFIPFQSQAADYVYVLAKP
jgi:hypothetical protein